MAPSERRNRNRSGPYDFGSISIDDCSSTPRSSTWALGQVGGFDGKQNISGRKSLAGSLIGGIAETQQVIDYCAARGITADVEIIRPDQIAEAYRRIVGKDVRYRFVIDMTSA